MDPHSTPPRAESLERSCSSGGPADWIASSGPVGGVELLRAWFGGLAYAPHRHDTYAIGVTECGVQVFDYRGSARASLPGQVAVLYPDERHDGRAGTDTGFGYRIVYIEPALLSEALRALSGRACPLPFVREPVITSTGLARAVQGAFQSGPAPLAIESLALDLAEGLLHGARITSPACTRRIDAPAVERARQFLDAHRTRVVQAAELEGVTGLSRYDLARQFKRMLGTSPYRYLVMRRLETARQWMRQGRSLAEAACEAGFSDQAHFTRMFKAAYGLTPARYRAAIRAGGRS